MTTSATVIESAPAKAAKAAKAPSDNPITGEIQTAAQLRSYADETNRMLRSGWKVDRVAALTNAGFAKLTAARTEWATKVNARLEVLRTTDSRVNYSLASGTNVTGARAASAIVREDKAVLASFASK